MDAFVVSILVDVMMSGWPISAMNFLTRINKPLINVRLMMWMKWMIVELKIFDKAVLKAFIEMSVDEASFGTFMECAKLRRVMGLLAGIDRRGGDGQQQRCSKHDDEARPETRQHGDE